MSQITGAEIVFKAFADHGVEYIFGYPGGAILPLYDELRNHKKIKHILVRHEQGAGHAAEGYARSSGKPGVVLVTSGPGATNMVTALTDAYMDSIPLVCVTGQVPTHLIGTDAFQECDTTGITRPCTKHNWLVKNIKDLPIIMHKAFHIATSGRPGPVLVDIPKDIQFQKTEYVKKEDVIQKINKVITEVESSELDKIVDLIYKSKKPIIYSGGGVVNSGDKASALLQDLVRMTGFPITSTLQGLGAFPGDDQQFLGMLGMHGTYEANNAMHDCDLMINIGARFDDRITGKIDKFSPGSKKIHIDIDPSSINKIIKVDHAIVGDVENVLNKLISVFKKKYPNFKNSNKENISEWWKQINKWKEKKCLSFVQGKKTIKPQYAIERLYELTKDQDTFITTEVGQHQMWAAQFIDYDYPKVKFLTSGGLGSMGYAVPASIGVKVGNDKDIVICICGDGGFTMSMTEILTAIEYKVNIKVLIINNSYQLMVKMWQEKFYEKQLMGVKMNNPPFEKVCESMGCHAIRIDINDDLNEKLNYVLNYKDGPIVANIITDENETVLPMVSPGMALDNMIIDEDNTEEFKGDAPC